MPGPDSRWRLPSARPAPPRPRSSRPHGTSRSPTTATGSWSRENIRQKANLGKPVLADFLHAEIEICRSDREHPLYDAAEGLRNLLNIMEAAPNLDLMEAPHLFESVIRLAIESTPSYVATKLEQMCPREKFESVSDWLAMLRVVTSALLRGLEQDGEEPEVLLDRSAK